MRAVIPITLDKSWPPEIGDRAAYATYRGRYLAHDPVCFGAINRAIARSNVTHLAKDIRTPTMVVAGRFDKVRPPAASEQFAQTIPGRPLRADRRRAHDAGAGAGPAAGAAAGFPGRNDTPQRTARSR